MKILVISDTHAETKNVDYLMAYYSGQIDTIIHCGDHIRDAEKLEEKYPDIDIYKVAGNCDFRGSVEETMKCVDVEGVKILVTHGHRHHVKYDYDELVIDAKAHDARLVVFGHTHVACVVEEQGVVLVNPGSLSEPRDTTMPSFAIIEIEQGIIKEVEVNNLISKNQIQQHPCMCR